MGNGDTTASLIAGNIWEKCNLQSCKLKKHPISNVMIKNCDGVILRKTDWHGKFLIAAYNNPKFCFKIEKDGYESVMIKDVNSISDEFYSLELNLEKGSLSTQYSYVRDY